MVVAMFRTARSRYWPALTGVIGVVIVAWGLYAWRSGGFGSNQLADAGASSGLAGATDAQSDQTPHGHAAATSLRADRPPVGPYGEPSIASGREPSDRDVEPTPDGDGDGQSGGLTATITVNAPATLSTESGVEIGAAAKRTVSILSIETGRAALARGDLPAARLALSQAMATDLSETDEAFARDELERLAQVLLFSRAVIPEDPLTGTHVVGGGDSINAIARKCKVSEDLLVSINHLAEPSRLAVGQRIKVIYGPFHAVISKSAHRMDVFLDDACVRRFRVGLGTNGGTPLGVWVVQNKLRNPEWTDPATGRRYLADDPDNPIGERWIGLRGIDGESLGRVGFGIHGTIDPESIGENMSMGCIRMLPEDVAFVYDLLVEGQSQIVIQP